MKYSISKSDLSRQVQFTVKLKVSTIIHIICYGILILLLLLQHHNKILTYSVPTSTVSLSAQAGNSTTADTPTNGSGITQLLPDKGGLSVYKSLVQSPQQPLAKLAVPQTISVPNPTTALPVQSSDYYVNWIIQHESGGNPNAVNASSGACGLFQRLPCDVPLGNVVAQMADGLAYIAERYGSPYNAYLYWVAHGNY